MSLETPRLTLLPCAPEHLLALIDHPEHFERLVGLPVADGLHGFYVSDDVSPTWLAALRSSSGPDPWRHGFFVVHRAAGSVIGSAGFKGPPDSAGIVEVAYGIVPGFQGQGYATEAAAALVAFAFASGQVRLVRAHTLPEENASTRVLLKCGFHHLGTVVDPEDGPVWRWERGPSGVTDLPIACALTPAELQSRGAELLPGLVARAIGRVPVTDGFRWAFAPTEGLLSELARVIDAERQCCRFLRFAVAAEGDGGPISLEITGPPGTRQFLEQLVTGA